MPAWHAAQDRIGKLIITPFAILALLLGAYMATDRDLWGETWVTVPLVVLVALLGLGGAFFSPQERRAEELARRDVDAAGHGEVVWSDEYRALNRRIASVGLLANVLWCSWRSSSWSPSPDRSRPHPPRAGACARGSRCAPAGGADRALRARALVRRRGLHVERRRGAVLRRRGGGATAVTGVDVMPATPAFEEAGRGAARRCGSSRATCTTRPWSPRRGVHDVVWCSGVLYHAPHPLLTLERLRDLTGSTLLLATEVLPEVPGLRRAAVFAPDPAPIRPTPSRWIPRAGTTGGGGG